MIFTDDLQTMLTAAVLLLVITSPLILTFFVFTSIKNTVVRILPLAAVPALLAALTVPVDAVVEVDWFFMGGHMGLDETGRTFLFLSSFIWFLGCFSCHSLLKSDRRQSSFLFFFLTCMVGNFGLILSRSTLAYYLFFAVMSFAIYGLVVHKGTGEALKAGRIYLILVMVGEVALFTALLILAHDTGSLAIEDIAGASCRPLPLVLLFIGFGVKIGTLPLHGWMAPAYQAAPIPAAAVLAGAMVNGGILGWIRFLPPEQTACPQGALLFVVAGALAAVYGVIVGLTRKHAGAVLGCSSISQMGLITVLFGLGMVDHDAGCYATPVLTLYVVHHALAKSSLFFGYNLVATQRQTWSRLQAAAILLPALTLAGLPFTGGAVAKTAFKELTVSLGEPWHGLSTIFLPITAMGTTMLMLHFMCMLMRSETSGNTCKALDRMIFAASFIATVLTLWLWPAARNSASHSLAGAKLWQTLWPVAGGCLLFLVWRRIFFREKVQVDKQKKQIVFDFSALTLMRRLQERKWPDIQRGGFTSYLTGLAPLLRKTEKIMGRWKVVGLSYLALCLSLLYLFL